MEKFRKVSAIFGKEQEAKQWIKEYEAKVEQAKAKIAGIVKESETVPIVQSGYNGLYVMAAEGGNCGSSAIYEMLALPPTKQVKEIKEGFLTISLELLPEYAGDHIFIYGALSMEQQTKEPRPFWKVRCESVSRPSKKAKFTRMAHPARKTTSSSWQPRIR
ncbi:MULTISPECIES: ABC transporter substrate-binding protein [Brevibacillus]|uniref:ABC transporter substrate-binding protein n=1 Tax=Brevibacillus TaxID=55080 RepID=UPI0020B1E1D5|nr:ABC transporter substrate-binding protein [Brevibacillus parabrevis]MED2254688.1 ABC transporter substrate-binding protein [Brevibacillus parabrevis]WDV94063.1 ABC transporter substrate-binding protein [Brevibacillus parabrevis]